jgi:hypothetical protein
VEREAAEVLSGAGRIRDTASGRGPCRHHGGLAPITHGRYSKLKSPRLRELIAEHAGDANPLDLLPEVAATRALFERYLETGGDDIDADTLAEGIRLAETRLEASA